MSMLSVRLPRELDRALPRKDRSAWVIHAIREHLRREQIAAIAQSAADNEKEELAILREWSTSTAPLQSVRPRKVKR